MKRKQKTCKILVCGVTGTGKSSSFRNMREPESVMYLNCEGGKELPWDIGFEEYEITDPYDIFNAFDAIAEGKFPHIKTVILDSITMAMETYVNNIINNPALSEKDRWDEWAKFAKNIHNLLDVQTVKSGINCIFTAHVLDIEIKGKKIIETKVPMQGNKLRNMGLEAYFTTVVGTKKVQLDELTDYQSDLLNITDREKKLEYKHVFQTQPVSGESLHERIKGSPTLWDDNEFFIDNDLQMVIDRHNGVTQSNTLKQWLADRQAALSVVSSTQPQGN